MRTVHSERFVLQTLLDGGLLLDLQFGSLLRLNRSAEFVWRRLLAGETHLAIAAALATSFHIPDDIALRDVEKALAMPPLVADSRPTNLRYEAVDAGYGLSIEGRTVLEVTADAATVRVLHQIDERDLTLYLRAIAPKIVALSGISVLHGSAVTKAGGQTIAFLGLSGAGKTTTARIFEKLGWHLLGEDKLVLSTNAGSPSVVVGGEQGINSWISRARRELRERRVGEWCDCHDMVTMSGAVTVPLTDVFFVDSARRSGTRIDLKALEPTAATAEIFRNAFFGSGAAEQWRRQLSVASAVASSTRAYEAVLPEGLAQLLAAARTYTDTTAS